MDKEQLNNPWKGLNFYTEGEILYGRNAEIQSLSQYIFNNKQTVLYGRSGIGKSSILNAGIFPKARLEGMTPVSIRLKHDDIDNYIWQIRAAIKNSGLKMKSILPAVDGHANESLWEFIHRHEFYNEDGESRVPLLVFDQFEEIFTLQKNENTKREFFRQLGNLLNDVKPNYVTEYEKKIRQMQSEDQEMKVVPSGALKGLSLRLNIRKKDANEQNTARYLVHPDYHIVFAMREDFLSSLELYVSSIPVMRDNRFGLLPINEEQAAEIILRPVPGLISKTVAKLVIEKVTGRTDFELDGKPEIEVDAAVLSLFLSKLYAKKPETDSQITIELVNTYSGHIIRDFYLESITSNEEDQELLSKETILILENQLLTREGRRNNVSRSDLIAQGVTVKELNILIDKRKLLRQFNHGNDIRVEYIHDILCPVVKERKEQRELIQEVEQKRQEEKQKLQRLQEQQERERTLRNIEYNRNKRATERNVLIHKGRRLIDNALDFGELRTINDIPLRTPVDKITAFVRLATGLYGEYFDDSSDSEFLNQQVFSDPLLDNSVVVLSFFKDDESAPTIDGIYGVELHYEGSLISDIFFKGKRVLSDGSVSFKEPIYILGGYCGIHIDYDEHMREIQRTYLDDSGKPVITLDGYSVVQTKFDENDNPVKVRYYIYDDQKKTAARHLHGNHGYDSVFDKKGNEIERHFVDENEQPTMIISGVYGKRMTYDTDTFRLLTISNIDYKGNLMADKDGYVADQKVYDEKGLPTMDYYLDEKGNPWRNPAGIYGTLDKIDFVNKIIEVYNVNEHGVFVDDKDGVQSTIIKINEKRQISEFYSKDKNGNIIVPENNGGIQLWEFDEQNRLRSYKLLNKDRRFVFGKRFDCNKEGTHIIREYYLSENGMGKNEDFNVEGIEFSLDGDDTLPVLQIFINENKQYKPCDDGFNAVRTWEDDKERIIKQLYYDVDGTPMPNNNGVFGVKVEYLDEETIKQINLDADENMMEDNNGVAFTIETKSSYGVFLTNYNINSEPHADDGWVYIHKERYSTRQGYRERFFVLNSSKEQIQINRPHRADSGWGLVPCIFVETTFDDRGRPLSEYFKDANGQFVGESDGDSYTIWEYDDINNLEILSLYNIVGNLRTRIKTIRDDKNRVIEQSYVNGNNEYIELERGYSGEIYEYDDEENRKIVSFIDSRGKVCNNKEGFAHRIFWYDNIGRLIAQKDVTIDGIVHGWIGFREFIDSEKRECAYYFHREDDQGHIISNNNGSVYDYFEDDNKGRTIKTLYLNENKTPLPDKDGDFGLRYEYDDEKRLTIMTCLDESGQPHNNKLGYGIVHLYENEDGKEIKRMYFTVEGAPITIKDLLLGCYGLCYEYPNEHNKIVGYLNKEGEITINSNGYAYREECLNPETGIRRVFYYDKDRNNTQSLEDENKEYGYAIAENDSRRTIYSLGKDGAAVNNACGYATKHELYDKSELSFYKYLDVDDKPVADNVGDYGTEIQRSDDGSMIRLISLNEKYEQHLNDYGYCICDIITDIAGDQVRIWRDMEGNQVLPKLRTIKRIKRRLLAFRKNGKAKPTFNCRQIGAIYDCVLGHVEGKGLGKRYGLTGTYVLLKYDNWTIGDNNEDLGKLISNVKKQSKSLLLLPVTLEGSLLKDSGDVIELNLPAGQIGIRFKDWGINIETLQIILDKKQQWDESNIVS